MKKYILGVDSGGTAFKVRAMSLEGQVLAEYEGIPCRHYQLGEEETIRRINLNMDAILALFDGRREDCLAIAAAVSGIDSPEDEEIVLRIYKALPGFSCPITCLNDGEMTHYAVTGGVGALVIAGTAALPLAATPRAKAPVWADGSSPSSVMRAPALTLLARRCSIILASWTGAWRKRR